ncbi:Y4yA family PLP-dependent enzyme [Streptomyces sp. NBS 14/10]|uniref:Y4yA family PLP-dependent enzyme n=1 Tax=Streptomyces sp. NBS 14/10 TaxID=1945643 RepID=UPI000B7D730E|nr:Y4yA family PLP-dependent enzyme [Streptomyces sp. NBS 14/10]KAK1183577.1 Y4yA family PLP-dependent enzyme [Streptomyces sp. NBS 14/10]NUS89877.1 Y4yA family PLP-dependent enzyme [Streptomyces sp.]
MGGALYLEPRLGPRLGSLLESDRLLHTLADALGSPLGVVLPDQLAENVERFRSVYRGHHLTGQIFLAHKANRSSALLRRLAATGAGVDVASLGELQHALGCGFAPSLITATGPKDPRFLWLAARTGATVSLDSPAELDQLATLTRAHGLPRVRVLLRLSGFESSGVKVLTRRSRFGTPVPELDTVLDTLMRYADAVELTGVAYHLDTTSAAEKAVALEGCLLALEDCRGRGLAPRAVDIGGGFGVNYLADRTQWERYTTELAQAVLGTRPPLTWGGHGYGLREDGGTLRGALGVYPAYRPVAGERYLDDLLSRPATAFGGRPLATLLLEHLYDLHTEPGRALLDQCGVTLARVLEVRDVGAGPLWVRLAATAGDIGLEEHGILMDPVLLPREPREPGEPRATASSAGPGASGGPVETYLFGSLCLESDLITRRVVHLPHRPAPGDLLAFVNTAGYCMDFHATRAQRQPVARKVAVWQDRAGWRWCLDEEYWPITPPGGQQ